MEQTDVFTVQSIRFVDESLEFDLINSSNRMQSVYSKSDIIQSTLMTAFLGHNELHVTFENDGKEIKRVLPFGLMRISSRNIQAQYCVSRIATQRVVVQRDHLEIFIKERADNIETAYNVREPALQKLLMTSFMFSTVDKFNLSLTIEEKIIRSAAIETSNNISFTPDKTTPPGLASPSLGLTALPDNTFEHDLAISDKYQSFSSELLTIALSGMAVIGFIVTNIFWKTNREGVSFQGSPDVLSNLKTCLIISLTSFGVCACCALLHRFIGPDSVAFHLDYLRRTLRNSKKDRLEAIRQRAKRDVRFSLSAILLTISTLGLSIAAISLAWGFIQLL